MTANARPTFRDRLMQAFRELVRAELPQLSYLGVWEYAVQVTDGVTVDATPVDTTVVPLPGIVGCPLRPGILGEQATPTVGSLCLVSFVNGDPTRPIVVGGDPNVPAASGKLVGGGPAAARVGDAATLHFGFATVLGIDLLLIGDATGPKYGFGAAGAGLAGSAVSIPTWGVIPHTAVAGAITTGSSRLAIG